jgi:adenylate kinase
LVLLFLGPPGAGKGTQGDLLARRLGVPKIATGDVLRAAVRDGTPTGLAAKAAMDRGDLVPDDVILAIMKDALSAPDADAGAILDGVVRTVPQAVGLERMLREIDKPLDAVVMFQVPDDELVRRLSARTVCESCQTPHTGRAPGSRCDRCGGRLVRRKDDEPGAVRNRLAVYGRQTAPVIDWYRSHGARLVTVDAVGTTEAVLARVVAAIAP